MSTFFEKLTGSKPKTASADPADLAPRPESKRAPRMYSQIKTADPEPHYLKVGTEEKEAAGEEEALPEEEGELTVDIYDQGDAIVIQSTVAGVSPENLDVSLTNDTVTIRGKRERHEEVDEKNYYYKELFWGGFARSVILPEEIEDDLAEATLKHGLLTIRMPKRKRGVVQKLKVKVN